MNFLRDFQDGDAKIKETVKPEASRDVKLGAKKYIQRRCTVVGNPAADYIFPWPAEQH